MAKAGNGSVLLALVLAGVAHAQVVASEEDAAETAVTRAATSELAGERPPSIGLFGRAHLGGSGRVAETRVDGATLAGAVFRWGDLPVPETALTRVELRAGTGDAEDVGFAPVLNLETLRADQSLVTRAELRWAPAFLSAAPSAPLGAPAAVESALDAAPPDPAWHAFRASLALGGPLVPGSVALAASAQLARRGHEPTDPRSAASAEGSELGALRLTLGSAAGTRVTLGLTLAHARRAPLCRRCDAAAASVEETAGGSLSVALEQAMDGLGLLLQISGALRRTDVGAVTGSALPSHTDLATGWTSQAPGRLAADLPWSELAQREQHAAGHLRLSGGGESLAWKTGLQLALGRAARSGQLPAGGRLLDLGAPCTLDAPAGCLAHVTVEPGDATASSLRAGAYAQVAWTPVAPLTLWLGVRVDAGRLGLPGGPSPWLLGVGPRATVAWDVAGDGRHLLLAHLGRAHDVGGLALAWRAGVQPMQRTALFDASSSAFDACGAPGARCLVSGGRGGRTWGALDPPRLDELQFSYRALLSLALRGGLDLTLRRVDDLWEEQEENRQRDPAGGLTVGTDGTFRSVRRVGSLGNARQRHQAVDAWLQARPGRVDARVGYTLSWTSGTAAASFDDLLRDVPRLGLAGGFLPDDRRHLLQAGVEAELLAGVFLGARLRYATGTPLWQTVAVSSDPGTRVPLTPRGTAMGSGGRLLSVRNPDTVRLDLEARVDLSAALGLAAPEVELAALVVNALGAEAPTLLSVSPGHVGTVLARQAPRHAELRVRVGY